MRCGYILFTCALVFAAGAVFATEQKKQTSLYDDYAAVLKKHVDDAGMVNYKSLKAKPEKLKTFIAAVGKLDPNSYDKWNNKEKIAFWLNAYNAFTLQAIIDNYPIKSSFLKSMYYPKNSIRQISGVWDKITFKVMGRLYTLKHMEHKILRKEFDEPRIHMALVCAAMGCPPLRNKPYIGLKLDAQLDDQSRRFLTNTQKFRIDRKNKRVYLSPIFKWFKKDFVHKYSSKKNTAAQKRKISVVLRFITSHLEKADSDYILDGAFKIKYLKYDWSLNEQQIKKKTSKGLKK